MDIESLSLYDYWKIIYKRKYVVILAVLATMFSTFIYTIMQPVIYETESTVRIGPPSTYSAGLNDAIGWYPGYMVSSETKIITSSHVAEKVARKIGWIKEDSNQAEIADAINRALSMCSVRSMENNFIKISARGSNKLILADVANAFALSYKEYDLEKRGREVKKSLENLSKRKQDIENSLKALEEEKQAFFEQNTKVSLSDSMTRQLMELETKKKELMNTYTDRHPLVRKIKVKIDDLKRQLAAVPASDKRLGRIKRDLRTTEEIYVAVNRQYEETKLALASVASFVTIVSGALPPNSPISPNKTLNLIAGMFLGLVLGLASAFIIENLDVSISTVEEIEKFLNVPILGIIPKVNVKKGKWSLLKFNFFKKDDEYLGLFRQQLVIGQDKKLSPIESYHSLRVNIFSQPNLNKNAVLVVTSSGAFEGKTLTAVNLAASAAFAGMKTLLVDLDLRKQAIHKVFGLSRDPGFSDVLMKQIHWQEAVRGTVDFVMGSIGIQGAVGFSGLDNLKIITSGKPLSNTTGLLDSSAWPRLVSEWKQNFDLVIIDSPPALLFIDAIMAAKHTDGVILLYRAGKISRLALKRVITQITSSGVRIIGMALNDVRASEMYPRYRYYGDYSHYAKQKELKA